MSRIISILFLLNLFLLNCKPQTSKQTTEQTHFDSTSTTALVTKENNDIELGDTREDNTVRIFPLDSVLEINFYRYKTTNGEIASSGVNIIDRQKNRWLFDSEGPQIESYSDIQKVNDSCFIVSVYYDVLASNDTLPKKIRIAKYDLNLNLTTNTYTFQKDTLFWPTPPPLNSKDIQRTIEDYKKHLYSKFLADSTNKDQPQIWAMFKIQQRLLSSFISGCDSCSVYSDRLFQKYDHALFASDSDYSGEIGAVFRILEKH